MNYTLRKTDDGWELVKDDKVVASFTGEDEAAYNDAVAHLGAIVARERGQVAAEGMDGAGDGAPTDDGLLPEAWTSDQGIAFQNALPGGRDFTECVWSWRDPSNNLVPLLLQTENAGHYGADLAGFVTEFTLNNGTVSATGRFYDNAAGMDFRRLLLDGRVFGVSVDPSENVTVEFECTEYNEEYGWCDAGVDKFVEYEIAGLTGVPFPGFEDAAIKLAASRHVMFIDPDRPGGTIRLANAVPVMVEGTREGLEGIKHVAAALTIPTAPPRAWFDLAEPQLGQEFLDGLGDDVLVEQGNSGMVSCPFTILDNGQVFGHLTYWGQCHRGNPWGPGQCAAPSPSSDEYADFHLGGRVICDDGTDLPTGLLHVGCEHSAAMDVRGVRDAAAHAGLAFAQVRVVDGEHGPWIRGALLPTVTPEQVVTLRALTLSGEWVPELGAIIAVNEGGLPQQRRVRVAASNGAEFPVAQAVLRASSKSGELTKLVGGNFVRRCPECQKRQAATRASGAATAGIERRLDELTRTLRTVERRTRHLIPVEQAATMTRLRPVTIPTEDSLPNGTRT